MPNPTSDPDGVDDFDLLLAIITAKISAAAEGVIDPQLENEYQRIIEPKIKTDEIT